MGRCERSPCADLAQIHGVKATFPSLSEDFASFFLRDYDDLNSSNVFGTTVALVK